jgi:SAM-dependent methyltransferase
MDKVEFDRFADEYRAVHASNIRITGEGPEYFAEYKVRDIAAEYQASHTNDQPNVLDFGAGVGTSVPFVRKYLPRSRITCIDVSAKSLAVARVRFGESARFVRFDGMTMPTFDSAMDIVFAAGVFHHIPPGEHTGLLRQLRRVLAADGLAFVFEHNPLNPLTVRTVNTCPFDENAKLIFARAMRQRFLDAGFREARIRYRIFFPRVLMTLRPLEKWMTWLPFGAQYYVVATK